MTRVKRQEALLLLKVLEEAGYEARLVGGCVRDEVLGLEPKDYDIASSARPEQILALFKEKSIRCLDYGREHGTVVALLRYGPIEVTTLREDVKTDGRHAEVAFHTDFKADALRRDFTMNAMSEDVYGRIFDYFEGKKHLEEKRIFFVGDPTTRIREDYLRILRYFRFKARFNLQSDRQTLEAIQNEVHGLENISKERITSEVQAILRCHKLGDTLEEMRESGVLAFIFPGSVNVSETLNWNQSIEDLAVIPSEFRAEARLAFLFWTLNLHQKVSDPKWSDSLDLQSPKLRLSNEEKNCIVHFLEAADLLPQVKSAQAEILLFVDRFDRKTPDFFLEVLIPFLKNIYKTSPQNLKKISDIVDVEKKYGFRRKPISIQGKELMDFLKLSPGPLVGEALEALRYAFLNGEWETKEEGFQWLRRLG